MSAAARGRPMWRERRIAHATTFRAMEYWLGNIGWIIYFLAPVVPAWFIARIFDSYQTDGATRSVVPLLIAFTVFEIAMVWGLAVVHRPMTVA